MAIMWPARLLLPLYTFKRRRTDSAVRLVPDPCVTDALDDPFGVSVEAAHRCVAVWTPFKPRVVGQDVGVRTADH